MLVRWLWHILWADWLRRLSDKLEFGEDRVQGMYYIIDDKLENILKELEIDKKIENTIDILPIIWENILMEIPMRVVSPNAKPEKLKGEGWQFITEQKGNVNPELEKLKDLL